MWAWLRLGWARGLLLALLLTGVNMAAMRYAQDTAAATRTPEYSSLGGLRAWRLSFDPQRKSGLLGHVEWADTRALLHWTNPEGLGQQAPSLWNTGMGVWVQEPSQRGGSVHSVMVVAGIDWPVDVCWVLSSPPKTQRMRLVLNEQTHCVHPSANDILADAKLAKLQQEVQTLWVGGPTTLVLGPELARRSSGEQWHQYTTGAWVGAGATPSETDASQARPTAATTTSLDSLRAKGWAIHEIRHEPSPLQQQALRARQRWQWAMAALGLVVGTLSAWGYRHVLALMVAIRRTGGASWRPMWRDALRLSLAVVVLMITVAIVPLAAQLACGVSCGAVPNANWLRSAQTMASWMTWSWAGLAMGSLLANSGVVLRATKQSLQTVLARGSQG